MSLSLRLSRDFCGLAPFEPRTMGRRRRRNLEGDRRIPGCHFPIELVVLHSHLMQVISDVRQTFGAFLHGFEYSVTQITPRAEPLKQGLGFRVIFAKDAFECQWIVYASKD